MGTVISPKRGGWRGGGGTFLSKPVPFMLSFTLRSISHLISEVESHQSDHHLPAHLPAPFQRLEHVVDTARGGGGGAVFIILYP